MIKSMTGFASVNREDDRATITVTIRALNHRYLDLQLRIPQSLAAIESDVRALVGKRVARGRVELSLSLQLRHAPNRLRLVDEDVGYLVAGPTVVVRATRTNCHRSKQSLVSISTNGDARPGDVGI